MTKRVTAAEPSVPIGAVLAAYRNGQQVSNDQLYGQLAESGIADRKAWEEKVRPE